MGKAVVFKPLTTAGSAAVRTSPAINVQARRSDKVPYPGYLSLVPITNDLRSDPFGPCLHIDSRIYGPEGGGPVVDAAVEIWHNSPDSDGKIQRAKLYTDGEGYVRFTTNFPPRRKGKNYEIYLKVVVGSGSYYARLTFNHTTLYLNSRKPATEAELMNTVLGFNVLLSSSCY